MARPSAPPAWVRYLVETRQTVMRPLELTSGYADRLLDLYCRFVPDPSDLVGIFPIAHEDQTGFVVCREHDAAVFFDVCQAAVIKSAYAALGGGDPQSDVFRLLQAAATLRIAPADRFVADRLGDAWAGPYDGPPFVEPDRLAAVRGTLARYVAPSLQQSFDLVVDCTIVAHELYHYRAKRALRDDEIHGAVHASYDTFVRVVAEDLSAFPVERLAPKERAKYARERAARRDYHARERAMVCEEMECDLFAFISAATVVIDQTPPAARTIALLERIVALHSIAYQLHLLHQALMERAQLYLTGGYGASDLPGSMSLFNLRRVAVGALASEWCAALLPSGSGAGPGVTEADHAGRLQRLQNALYLEMSNDVLMPAVPRLRACFALLDRTFPPQARPEQRPIGNADERLFLSGLALRLDDGVLSNMLRGGPSGLRARIRSFVAGGGR